MVLLIDNYDSFAYNLYQLIEPLKPGCEVFRNDKISLDDVRDKNPEAIPPKSNMKYLMFVKQ